MCGIAGGIDIGYDRAQDALQAIAHRGPDADGIWQGRLGDKSAWLGHRRLSIIDTSDAGRQPMEKNGLVICFNGEIYNYREIAAELKQHGVSFNSSSDTEVLLEAWRVWGEKALAKLRGMFAFAIFDQHNNELILVRDQFGIKPLYLLEQAGGIAFASEIKALKLMLENAEINREAIIASLLYVWAPEPISAYKNIRRLPAGHMLTIKADGSRVEKPFWNMVDFLHQNQPPVTIASARRKLEESVAAHMIADVPVASFLSGGLDSSIITALAAHHNPALECYTIAFRSSDKAFEAMPDDLHYARLAAKHLRVKLNEIIIEPEVVSMLPQMAAIMDEPIGDAAAINLFLMCRTARENGIKVLLSGMGADEMFGGYRRHLATLMASRYRILPAALRKFIHAAVNKLPVAGNAGGYRYIRWAKRFLDIAELSDSRSYMRSYSYYDEDELRGLLNFNAEAEIASLMQQHDGWFGAWPENDKIARMNMTDMQAFLPGLNLTYTDRASMAASCEVRVPFVDREIAHMAFSCRPEQKISGFTQKAILKTAAEAWLPKEIIYRPKASFGVPLRAWIRHDLADMVGDMLPSGRMVKDGWVKKEMLQKMIKENASGERDYAQHIWQFLTLEHWLRNA